MTNRMILSKPFGNIIFFGNSGNRLISGFLSSSSGATWRANEPVGYTALTQSAFDTRTTPAGWFGFQNTNDNFCVEITDATAPVSPSKAIRAVFKVGFSDNDTPVVLEYTFPTEQQEFYMAFAMRLPGPTWEWHSSGVNKMFFIDTNSDSNPEITNEGVISLISDNPSDVRLEVHIQDPTIQELVHNVTPVSWTLDSWKKCEIQCIRSTGGGANGTVKLWVDGVLCINRTDVSWKATGSAAFRAARFHPNWGGSASQLKTQEDYVDIDHIYMSGKPIPSTYASTSFDNGAIGVGFTNPWGDRITFPDDPTSSGRGKVAQIKYAPSSGGSMERAVAWNKSPGLTYGEELWFKGDFYQKSGTGSYDANHNRKIVDWQGNATRMTLNRRDLDLRVSIVSRMSGTETEVIAESTGITLNDDTWYRLEVRCVMNSADLVEDGILQIFVNESATPAYSRTTGLGWITEQGGSLTSLYDFLVGFQLTIDNGDPVYEDTRYWDNLYFSTGRL